MYLPKVGKLKKVVSSVSGCDISAAASKQHVAFLLAALGHVFSRTLPAEEGLLPLAPPASQQDHRIQVRATLHAPCPLWEMMLPGPGAPTTTFLFGCSVVLPLAMALPLPSVSLGSFWQSSLAMQFSSPDSLPSSGMWISWLWLPWLPLSLSSPYLRSSLQRL